MPEDKITSTEFKMCVQRLEQLDSHWLRCKDYEAVQRVLETGEMHIDVSDVEKLLAICEYDLKEKIKFAPNTLKVISAILKKVKDGEYPTLLDLEPTALAIIQIIKTAALLSKIETLKALCFDTLQLYPNTTLITLATTHCNEVIEIFNLYGHSRIPLENRIQTCNLIHKWLKILPSEKRVEFVKEGLSAWFSKTIPTVMTYLSEPKQENFKPLLTLELLTEELVSIEYSDHPQWLSVLECICNTKKYPVIMKNLLEKGSNIWHRLWIIFIKLLKNQITRSNYEKGSPINSMLLIVEAAFKMDKTNRCRAFACWNVLIDNFCNETNENYLTKRVKLLVVPLKSNNAKVEEIALAKFDSWWHLITKFQHNMDKYIGLIIIPFLQFCFGKPSESELNVLVSGKLSETLKKKCRQGLIEICGHDANCNQCPSLPGINGIKFSLHDHIVYVVHSFVTAVKISTSSKDDEETAQQIKCLSKSFLKLIGGLPIDNTKTQVITEIMHGFEQFLLLGNNLSDILFDVIIPSLFNEENLYKLVFMLNHEGCSKPLHDLVMIIVKQELRSFFIRFNSQELISKWKLITNIIVMESLNSSHLIESILKDMPSNVNSFAMWTALVESMLECKHDLSSNICDTLLWPLEHMNQYSDIQISAMAWYKLYIKDPKSKDEEELFFKIINSNDNIDSNKILKIYAINAILKRALTNDTSSIYLKEVELLEKLIKSIENFEHNVQVFPILIDTLVMLMDCATITINYTLAEHTLCSIKHVLKLMPQVLTQDSVHSHQILIGSLLKSMDKLFKIESFSKFIPIICDDLSEYSTLFSNQTALKKLVFSILKTFDKSKTITTPESITADINDVDGVDESSKKPALTAVTADQDLNNFPIPNTKVVPKKNKKKEASIVNRVVENGEEYVVVKSNWKFNPRKLTENQKEKLQRKREDIPALYQDLSQSQDEFRLTSWKTDSQDASSTNSQSNVSLNNQSSSILQNLPSIDVVPKIMENLMTEKDKQKETDYLHKDMPNNVIKVNQLASPINSKSPRMALKDRVFRNVRNLIENSTLPKDNINPSENPIENVTMTPISNLRNSNNAISSAPPLISAERPSRVKRKPRKFDDTDVLTLKKRQRSLSQSDMQNSSTNNSDNPLESNITNDIAKEKIIVENDHCLENPIITDNDVAEDLGVTKENHEAESCDVESTNVEPAVVQIDLTQVIDQEINSEDKDVKPDLRDTQPIDITELKENKSFQTTQFNTKKIVTSTPTSKLKELNCEKSSSKRRDAQPIDNTELKESERAQTTQSDNKKIITSTPTSKLNELNSVKSSSKKSSVKKSRIEKELAIDMVEGHPFLKCHSEKRVTRKKLLSSETSLKRKSLSDKINKSTSDTNKTVAKMGKVPKVKNGSPSVIVTESLEMGCTPSTDLPHSVELPYSEDIIESSQDSTLSTLSVKSTKKTPKKIPVVSIEKVNLQNKLSQSKIETQKFLENEIVLLHSSQSTNQLNKDDIDISRNKTLSEKTVLDSTENMDTEPMGNKNNSDVILIDNYESPITINTEEAYVGPDTQEIAEADTQPTDSLDFMEDRLPEIEKSKESHFEFTVQNDIVESSTENASPNKEKDTTEVSIHTESGMQVPINTENDITMTAVEPNDEMSTIEQEKNSESSSPYKDDAQRKKDFLNNTLQISPIKTLSPEREKKSPSPDSSSDYVVIKLSSPVHINGEPFEKGSSPEIFTNDKVSPDKRDQSPPRVEVSVSSTSPSSSLSLKKNRPQVRSGGRAAQMLGLCVPDRFQTIRTDRTEPEGPKKSSPSNTPARRNLKIIYNTAIDDSENVVEKDSSENFLSLNRLLPHVDCSPSVPILKRKLVEIIDDATASPASKRKRVSFHDPPVSTTVAVQKYIEPGSLRSPQSSVLKRLERQARSHTNMKSQRRLDTAFKLDSILTKAVESFTEVDALINLTDDTEGSSLEQTPAVEVVKTSELNDTDPICSMLLNCKDPIDKIATELSSPAMKYLLIKELEGKVETIGDLAKMTELEVNRLCIKAPKVQIAKKVLADYATKILLVHDNQEKDVADDPVLHEEVTKPMLIVHNVEVQTSQLVTNDVEIQAIVSEKQTCTQTEVVPILHVQVQTEESSFKSTSDVITSCLTERHDFVEKLSEQLETSSIQQLTEELPVNTLTDILLKKMTASDSTEVLNLVLEQNRELSANAQLTFLRDYLVDRFDSKDLILLCSQMLQKYHDKLV